MTRYERILPCICTERIRNLGGGGFAGAEVVYILRIMKIFCYYFDISRLFYY